MEKMYGEAMYEEARAANLASSHGASDGVCACCEDDAHVRITYPGGGVVHYCEQCADEEEMYCDGGEYDGCQLRGPRCLEMLASEPCRFFCDECLEPSAPPPLQAPQPPAPPAAPKKKKKKRGKKKKNTTSPASSTPSATPTPPSDAPAPVPSFAAHVPDAPACHDYLLPSSPLGVRPAAEVALLVHALVGAFYKYYRAVGGGDMLAALDAAAPIDAGGVDGLDGRIEVVRRLLSKTNPIMCEVKRHLCPVLPDGTTHHPDESLLPGSHPCHHNPMVREVQEALASDQQLPAGDHAPPCHDYLLPSSPPGVRPAAEVALIVHELVGAFYKYYRAVGGGDMLAALDAAAPIDAGGVDGLDGRIEVVRRLLSKTNPIMCEVKRHLCPVLPDGTTHHPDESLLPGSHPCHHNPMVREVQEALASDQQLPAGDGAARATTCVSAARRGTHTSAAHGGTHLDHFDDASDDYHADGANEAHSAGMRAAHCGTHAGRFDDASDDYYADGANEARSTAACAQIHRPRGPSSGTHNGTHTSRHAVRFTNGSCVECGATADLDADPFSPGDNVCETCWVATARPCVECRVMGPTGRVEERPEWHFCDECWEDMGYLRRRRVHGPPPHTPTPALSGLPPSAASLAAPAPLPSGHPPSAAFPVAQALFDACDAAAPRSTFPAGGVGAGLSASCESN